MASLSPEEAKALTTDWWMIGRDEQLPPATDWTYWAVIAGRGFGKTRTGAEWACDTARRNPGTIGHLVAPTAGDIEKVMLAGPSGILTISKPDFMPRYIGSKSKLIWPNGTIAYTFSAEEPDRLRGPQCHWSWCDELAAWKRLKDTWDQLQMGYRLEPTLGCIVTTTPRPLQIIKELLAKNRSDVVVTRGSTYANRANLSAKFFQEVVTKYEGTRLGRQELNAEVLEDTPGALWVLDQIEKTRIEIQPPDLNRIVVAVDPPASSGENADECGIVVAGVDKHRRGYLLADRSSHRDTPFEWATKAVKAYHEFKADRIVAEVNNGGEMVEAIIRQVDASVSYTAVHASRGKVTRAEPVSALYEQGRISHVGNFSALEDQMCAFTADFDRSKMGYSPDRVDALVWAFTELLIADNASGFLDFYREKSEAALAAKNTGKPDDKTDQAGGQGNVAVSPSVWLDNR
jgi:phage terminase large subunit-like protein